MPRCWEQAWRGYSLIEESVGSRRGSLGPWVRRLTIKVGQVKWELATGYLVINIPSLEQLDPQSEKSPIYLPKSEFLHIQRPRIRRVLLWSFPDIDPGFLPSLLCSWHDIITWICVCKAGWYVGQIHFLIFFGEWIPQLWLRVLNPTYSGNHGLSRVLVHAGISLDLPWYPWLYPYHVHAKHAVQPLRWIVKWWRSLRRVRRYVRYVGRVSNHAVVVTDGMSGFICFPQYLIVSNGCWHWRRRHPSFQESTS